MAKQKKRNNKSKTKKTFNLFSYNPTVPVSPKQQVYDNIVFEAQKHNSSSLDEFLGKVFKHPLCPDDINCKYSTYNDLFKNYTYGFKDFDCESIWFKQLFTNNYSDINSFLKIKEEIDICILKSDIERALELIQKVEDEICISLWSIELIVHIKKEFLNEDTSDFLNKIKQASNNNISDFYFQQLILKSESKEISDFISNLIEVIQEMRDTTNDIFINYFADIISSYFLPYEYDLNRNVNEKSLRNVTCYSLIDQYIFFKIHIKEKILYGNGLNEIEEKALKEILLYVNDNELVNLLNPPVEMKDIDPDYLKIINYYTRENYELTQTEIINQLNKSSSVMSFIEIFARCSIYENRDSVIRKDTLFNKISSYLINILLTNEDTLQSLSELEKIILKFKYSNWTIPIAFHINRFVNEKNKFLFLSKKEMHLLGNKITPYGIPNYDYKELINLLGINNEDLSLNRKLKLVNIDSLNSIELYNFLDDLESNIKIYSDFLIEKSEILLSSNKIDECLNFITESYLKDNMYHIVLPIRGVLESIETNDFMSDSINIPLVYDIYSKRIDSHRDEIYLEKFQDYIDNFDEFKPSDIFDQRKFLCQREKYFLKYICTPEILDVYPEYGCTDNLKRERIKILDLLIIHEKSDYIKELYKIEKTAIFDELIFEKLKTDFHSSKIYVDIESLKNKREDEYKRLFNLLLLAKSSEDEKEEYIQLDENEDVWIPVTDTSSIISKIYTTLFNDFVSNPDFGLDKYLSADIRHGVFIPHIRSSIENCHLLTEVNNSIYEDNNYWLDKYPFVVQELRDKLNSALKEFSKDFDLELNNANNWFKINIYVEEPDNIPLGDGLFDFTKSKERLNILQESLTKELDFESFFNIIISYMWDITEKGAYESKNRLNTLLKPNLISIIDQLEKNIHSIKHTVPFKELLDAIQVAKSYIHSDFEKVLNWFNCMQDNNNTEQYSLSSTLYACTDTFNNIANETSISLSFPSSSQDDLLFLTYRETRALMSSIYTALINSNTYKTVNSNITLNISENDKSYVINLKNEFNLDENKTKEEFLSELREKLSDRYCKLSTSEGGTGLYKIYNFLSTVSNKFTFNIDIVDNCFIVKIGVKK